LKILTRLRFLNEHLWRRIRDHIGANCNALRGHTKEHRQNACLMMTAYGFLAVFSALYSPAPALSAYKGVLILIDVLLVLVALQYISSIGQEYSNILLDLSYFMLILMVIVQDWVEFLSQRNPCIQ